MVKFDCTERCSAPDSFFSGVPNIKVPNEANTDVMVEVGLNDANAHNVEWEILVANSKSANRINYQVTINGQSLESSNGVIDGLNYHKEETTKG